MFDCAGPSLFTAPSYDAPPLPPRARRGFWLSRFGTGAVFYKTWVRNFARKTARLIDQTFWLKLYAIRAECRPPRPPHRTVPRARAGRNRPCTTARACPPRPAPGTSLRRAPSLDEHLPRERRGRNTMLRVQRCVHVQPFSHPELDSRSWHNKMRPPATSFHV